MIGAIDLGGTKILAGVFPIDGTVDGDLHGVSWPDPRAWRPLVRRRIDTLVGRGADDIISRMVRLVGELAAQAVAEAAALSRRGTEARLVGLGVAAPGPLNSRSGVIVHAPNLCWHGVPLAARLGEALGVPVWLDNDANLAALAEWSVRENSPDPLLYVTVSTGVGGGIVAGGEILRGVSDRAGEIGHITVGGAHRCNCGNTGCLETVASGTALIREASGRFGRSVTAEELSRLFQRGDARATEVVRQGAGWLGLGLAAAAAMIDPEVVVLGGGVTRLGPAYFDLVWAELAARLMPESWRDVDRGPLLEPARLGDDASLLGAALNAWRHHHGRGDRL